VDSARPPQIVLEELSACPDAAAARAELGGVLAPSMAPTGGWSVTVRFARTGGHLSIDSLVADPNGLTVAHRQMSSDGAACAGLSKAVGVWASLVLDAEVERVKHGADETSAPVEPPPAPPAARAASLWPDPDVSEKRSPEDAMFLRHERQERTIELGLETFLMGGTGGGPVLGPAIYGILEAGRGIFIRPTLMVGHSVGTADTTSTPETFAGLRLDGCARLPGFYREHRGLQLDLCGGAETGLSQVDSGGAAPGSPSLTPFLAIGPSFGLRGELGSSLSATIRGVTEVALLRDQVNTNSYIVSPSLFVGRAEVGLSWALR
jgi:hypothetical protein